jgi:hypothetical protein
MSEVKVNKISPRSGTDVTLGDSGDTFTIPSGATINNQGTAVNFGATGSASWVTTVKTGDFTAVAGEGYFVNTTSGEIDVTLPASPSAGDVVAVKDYANTWDTSNCILLRNGSNIGGQALNSTLSTEGLAVTLVYVDATKGWLVTDSGLQSEAPGPQYIVASGGTETNSPCGNFKIHTFTGPGTFAVTQGGNCAGSNTVDYLVVAGGGAGGAHGGDGSTVGGGGGAGGYRFSNGTASGCYTAGPSPLGATALPVTAQCYAIVVGGGGTSAFPGNTAPASKGNNSTFSTITSTGGGGGNGSGMCCAAKGNGGSGGGGRAYNSTIPGGTGNTPPTTPSQGNDGGDGNNPKLGGGGGGAGGAGSPGGSPLPANTGRGGGGIGLTSCITASPVARGGGGGGANTDVPANGGAGGGGNGPPSSSGGTGTAGTVNTGGGGGGGPHGQTPNANGGAGGSGIVVIRYKFQ